MQRSKSGYADAHRIRGNRRILSEIRGLEAVVSEYKVIAKEVTSVIWRDVEKAAQELGQQVTAELSAGWEPQGGIASIQAGTGVYLIQALVRH